MKKFTAIILAMMLITAIFAVSANAASVVQPWFDNVVLTGSSYKIQGWVIIDGDTIADIGYRIDDNDPVFSSLQERSMEIVSVMGSDPAKTNGFNVQISAGELPAGEHVIHVVVKTAGGEFLDVNDGENDGFRVVGTGDASAYVKQCNYDVTDNEGPDYRFYGWVVIEGDTIADIGYRIDDNKPVFSSLKDRSNEVAAVIGSDPAKTNGFDVLLSEGDLAEGNHVLHVVVKTAGGQLLDVNQGDVDGYSVVGTKTGGQPNPPSGDAAIIAIAAVGCIALAGVVVAKKVR